MFDDERTFRVNSDILEGREGFVTRLRQFDDAIARSCRTPALNDPDIWLKGQPDGP